MFKIFDSSEAVDIVVLSDSIAIRKAVSDLQENLRALSGKDQGFDVVTHSEKAITIMTASDAPSYKEGYCVEVSDKGVVIKGRDELGTIFGIYAFASRSLKIDPMYRFTDVFPKRTDELYLEDTHFTSREKQVPLRGWFINDEDFLSGYKVHGSKRRIYHNQEFFKEIISAEMIDMICETALRLEMNLLIPCSYLDILNPAEEEIVSAVVSRGMYISMHHQEPVGTGYFAAFNYFDEHFTGKDVSFIKNPKEMEEVWRTYVKKWAKYGKNVVWQLGLRGQGDMAIWSTDPSISSSMEQRGRIISDAIKLQCKIIEETLGTDDYLSTMTLWMEGAALYDQGYLDVPKNTVTVFSDLGMTQLMSSDFYNVKRSDGCKYGIYYHAAMHIEGPHFTDGTHPEKMLFCYKEAERLNSLHISILNVGNLREVCPSVRLNAGMLQGYLSNFSFEGYFKTNYPDLFGEVWEEVAELDMEYFDAIGDLGDDMINGYCSVTDFHYYKYENLPYTLFPLNDGMLLRLGSSFFGKWEGAVTDILIKNEKNLDHIQKVLLECIEKFSDLLPKLSQLQEIIPEETTYFYRFSRIYRTRYMLNLSKWVYHASQMYKGIDFDKNKSAAILALSNILSFRNEFNQGKWQGWYKNDLRHNTPGCLDLTMNYKK